MKKIRRIERIGVLLTALSGAIGACISLSAAMGLLLGGAIMVGNLHILGTIVNRALQPDAHASFGLIAAFVGKLAFLFGSFALLILVFKVNPIVLAIGASTLLMAILCDAMLPAASA